MCIGRKGRGGMSAELSFSGNCSALQTIQMNQDTVAAKLFKCIFSML